MACVQATQLILPIISMIVLLREVLGKLMSEKFTISSVYIIYRMRANQTEITIFQQEKKKKKTK
jgi:hypothetical protein